MFDAIALAAVPTALVVLAGFSLGWGHNLVQRSVVLPSDLDGDGSYSTHWVKVWAAAVAVVLALVFVVGAGLLAWSLSREEQATERQRSTCCCAAAEAVQSSDRSLQDAGEETGASPKREKKNLGSPSGGQPTSKAVCVPAALTPPPSPHPPPAASATSP